MEVDLLPNLPSPRSISSTVIRLSNYSTSTFLLMIVFLTVVRTINVI